MLRERLNKFAENVLIHRLCRGECVHTFIVWNTIYKTHHAMECQKNYIVTPLNIIIFAHPLLSLFEGKYISLSFRHSHNELYFNALQLLSNNWLDCSNMLLVMLNTIFV